MRNVITDFERYAITQKDELYIYIFIYKQTNTSKKLPDQSNLVKIINNAQQFWD